CCLFIHTSVSLCALRSFPTRRSSRSLGRPHIADVLVRNGVFAHRDQAFEDLLSTRSPYYVSHAAPDPVRATELVVAAGGAAVLADRKSTRLNSSHVKISYAVFCLKKK